MHDDALRPALLLLALGAVAFGMRRATGRLAPRVALLPILFLLTRGPVIAAWVVGAAGMFALLVHSIQANGHDPSAQWPLIAGLSVFCGLGAAVPLVGVPFFVMRLFAAAPELPLERGEAVAREWPANHFLDSEGRGGKMLLTTERLGFCPHRFNVQLTTWSVRRADITGVSVEGERLLLVTHAGAAEPAWFVVPDPRQVAREIDPALAG